MDYARSPNAEREEFVNLSRKHTDEAAIIMGDFNYGKINWETLEATAEGAEFLEMVQDFSNTTCYGANQRFQLNGGPCITHRTRTGGRSRDWMPSSK